MTVPKVTFHERIRSQQSRLNQFRALVPGKVTKGIDEAISQLSSTPPHLEAALVFLRKALGYIIDDLYEHEFKKPAGTDPLERKIHQLKLPQPIRGAIEYVKNLGNTAAHGEREEREPIKEEDVFTSLDSFTRVVEWYSKQVAAPPSPPPPPSGEVAAQTRSTEPPKWPLTALAAFAAIIIAFWTVLSSTQRGPLALSAVLSTIFLVSCCCLFFSRKPMERVLGSYGHVPDDLIPKYGRNIRNWALFGIGVFSLALATSLYAAFRQKSGRLVPVERKSTKLSPATTGSPEALQQYEMARTVKAAQGSRAAVPLYERAIELDPQFAEAYADLSAAYYDLGEGEKSKKNAARAYELRGRVNNQREELHIEANYFDMVTGEIIRANQVYLNWIQLYPDDYRPHQNLGSNYYDLGEYQKAIDQEAKVLELQPDNVNAFAALMGNYLAFGNIEMANSFFEKAHALGLDHTMLTLYRYHTAFLAGDESTMKDQLRLASGKPGADALRSAESDTKAYYGRFRDARVLSEQAARLAQAAGDLETAAGWKANAAMREAAVGNRDKALGIGREALQMSGGKYVKLQAALAFARAEQSAEAKKAISALDREYPLDTIVQNYWLPTIRAAIELSNGNAQKAIELLQVTEPYELGEALQGYMYPVYLRGQAYLMLHQGDKAAEEFQKILNNRGIVVNFVLGSLARLQLARAEQMHGDTASAHKHYEEFLKLWKDADPDLPIFHEALHDYESLK